MSLGVIEGELDRLRERHAGVTDGTLADYIPELAKANPSWFGVSLCTVDGTVHESGDSREAFTIQSVSKPFVFALALAARGHDAVLERVGVEPSGDAFNSIQLDRWDRPHNPMVNAGAIATVGMIPGTTEARTDRIVTMLSAFAGRSLSVDEAVYRSERETGDRNRAIGHLLKNVGALEGDVDDTLDVYFRQCSVLVTATDLAVMAATLANGGVNPLTGTTVVAPEVVGDVLSVMYTAGMYDFSGEWAYKTGLPAKSGVAGGVTALVPAQVGVGVFSPPVDERGNSVRGVAVCEELSGRFGFHLFRGGASAKLPLRSTTTGRERRSMRIRPSSELDALGQYGDRIAVVEAQGPWSFVACERLFAHVESVDPDYLAIDTSGIGSVDETAKVLMRDFISGAGSKGLRVVTAGRLPEGLFGVGADHHDSLDAALEWSENQLLADLGRAAVGMEVSFADSDLCAGMPEAAARRVERSTQERILVPGEVLVKEGEQECSVFVVLAGHLTAEVEGRRVAAFGPGAMIGEMGFLTGDPRSATIVADETCRLAELESLEGLGAELRAAATKAIGTVVARRLSATTAEAARA